MFMNCNSDTNIILPYISYLQINLAQRSTFSPLHKLSLTQKQPPLPRESPPPIYQALNDLHHIFLREIRFSSEVQVNSQQAYLGHCFEIFVVQLTQSQPSVVLRLCPRERGIPLVDNSDPNSIMPWKGEDRFCNICSSLISTSYYLIQKSIHILRLKFQVIQILQSIWEEILK